jgi:aminoglycoside phosphotransferase family enzyme
MVSIEEKIRFLRDPGAHAPGTRQVEVRETHMSWLFLTGALVYKLKKPVRYPFLDFSTQALRHHFCEEELRLNRRLTRNVYLRVVALREDRAGRLSIGGEGRAIDWLVEMRQLHEEDTLERRIETGRATRDDFVKTAQVLAGFYAAQEPQIADGGAYLDHLWQEQAVNRAILKMAQLGLAEIAAGPLAAVDAALLKLAPAIEHRIARGLIVEGHGDLRPEHVFIGAPVQIIDCLEFNRAMRIIDPHDEVNYLALECEMLGARDARTLLCGFVAKRLGNEPEPRLLALYRAFRALLRARLSIAHLLETPVRKPEKWRPLALRYLEVASRESIILQDLQDR